MMRRITDPQQLAAYRLAHIPAELRAVAQHAKCKTGDAEAWTWTDAQGRARAVGFFGRSQNAYSGTSSCIGHAYYFKTAEARAAWVRGLFERATSAAQRKEATRAEKAAKRAQPHGLQVGDVLRSSWGYDQTNVDYYEVTRTIGTTMVEIREIGQQREDGAQYMTGQCVPCPGAYTGEPRRVRVSDYGARDSVRINSFASAHKIACQVVAGVKVFPAANWTAYA